MNRAKFPLLPVPLPTMNHRQILAIFLTSTLCIATVPTLFLEACAQTKSNLHESSETEKPNNSNRPIQDKWALVIGISKYKDKGYNLRFPAKDATDFAATLIEDLNFQPDHVKLLIDENATRKNILSLLGDVWLPRVAQRDDLVLIYISSHGSPSDIDIGKVNYIVAHDTEVKSLYATGIPMQDLMRIIKGRVNSDRIVMILDSCHSGAVDPADRAKGLFRSSNIDAEEIAQGTGQLVISSSLPKERSWESMHYDGSVFTKHLIDALKSFGDDTKLSEVFRYTKNKVKEEVERDRGESQTPVLKSKWNGDELILSSNPKNPRPGININIGEVKVVVMPAVKEKINETEEVFETKDSQAEAKTSQIKKDHNQSNDIIKKLPDRFRFKLDAANNLIPAKYAHSGVFEWNPKKLQYIVKWDDGKRGYAHVKSIEDNHVIIEEGTRYLFGLAKNTYEGKITNSKIVGTMKGHDAWTTWHGTFEAWWRPN